MKICFGIPSWLPDSEPDRTQRRERINKLFKQLNDLWPTIDILVIAQNWQDFKPIKTNNNQIIIEYPPLGILGARKTLREEFLKRNYDYIIMMDDDCIIDYIRDEPQKYIEEVKKHPNGFCFMPGHNSRYHPYCGAQLNLCAISRFIYEKEPMVDIDPQKNEGYEDSIFACLLHHKYGEYEFKPPKYIRCTQWLNQKEKIPSTWCNEKRPWYFMNKNSNKIQEYIMIHKDLPPNYRDMIEKPHPIEYKVDGRQDDTYLYF